MTLLDAKPMVQVKKMRHPAQVRPPPVRCFVKHGSPHGAPLLPLPKSRAHAHMRRRLGACPWGEQVYLTCMELISRLAGKGLIHCDFNEFNLLINDEEEVRQMTHVR